MVVHGGRPHNDWGKVAAPVTGEETVAPPPAPAELPSPLGSTDTSGASLHPTAECTISVDKRGGGS